MPLPYVYAFLLVAFDAGLGGTEYVEWAGVAKSIKSRHLDKGSATGTSRKG